MQESTDLDKDGYPTEEALDKIRNWDYNDFHGLFDYVKSIWWCADMLWDSAMPGQYDHEDVELPTYYISTGGWSGNEDIIRAMQENKMLWFMCWTQSRRGGHYIFEERGFKKVE